MRFCSHLDITRYMTRLMRKAAIPLWHTEGFNPRPYITFALPLPLGFLSSYEVMDIRLTDDDYDINSLSETLNSFCHEGIVFFRAAEPVLKAGNLAAADYEIVFDDGGALAGALKEFLAKDKITVLKKTKRGNEKEIDLKEHLSDVSVTENNENTLLKLTLPAGGSLNINPELLLSAFCEKGDTPYTITRLVLKDNAGKVFA